MTILVNIVVSKSVISGTRNSFRRSGNIFGAILLSGVLFALMHMNFNQAAYALLLGIMMALLAEAAGSTVAPFIMHFIFNGHLQDKLAGVLEEELETGLTTEELIMAISVYLLLAVVGTAIALCVVTWIASNEGKQNFLRTIWASRKSRGERLWSVCLIIGIVLALAYMIFEIIIFQ